MDQPEEMIRAMVAGTKIERRFVSDKGLHLVFLKNLLTA